MIARDAERTEAIDIIQRRYTKAGKMTREQAALTHRSLDSVLEAKMFPTTKAIANVYQEALRNAFRMARERRAGDARQEAGS